MFGAHSGFRVVFGSVGDSSDDRIDNLIQFL